MMETGDDDVDVETFPQKYQHAINTQNCIGQSYVFAGKLSQEWMKFFEEKQSNKQKNDKRKQMDMYGIPQLRR